MEHLGRSPANVPNIDFILGSEKRTGGASGAGERETRWSLSGKLRLSPRWRA